MNLAEQPKRTAPIGHWLHMRSIGGVVPGHEWVRVAKAAAVHVPGGGAVQSLSFSASRSSTTLTRRDPPPPVLLLLGSGNAFPATTRCKPHKHALWERNTRSKHDHNTRQFTAGEPRRAPSAEPAAKERHEGPGVGKETTASATATMVMAACRSTG